MKKFVSLLCIIMSTVVIVDNSEAQARYIFQIDLRQQIKDSVFVPSEHSVVLEGNQLPFSSTKNFKLTDKTPADSIYTVEIQFPYLSVGKKLEYNFKIMRKEGDLEESQTRILSIQEATRKILDVTFFDNFAW